MTDYITVYITMPIYRMCLCASIYLLMAVGVERYLAVCRPHHYREVHQRPNRSTSSTTTTRYILPNINGFSHEIDKSNLANKIIRTLSILKTRTN